MTGEGPRRSARLQQRAVDASATAEPTEAEVEEARKLLGAFAAGEDARTAERRRTQTPGFVPYWGRFLSVFGRHDHPLVAAARAGYARKALALLRAGSPVDASDTVVGFLSESGPGRQDRQWQHTSETGLVAACMGGHAGVAKVLLDHGANPSWRTFVIPGVKSPQSQRDDQWTPLAAARASGSAACVELVEAGLFRKKLAFFEKVLDFRRRLAKFEDEDERDGAYHARFEELADMYLHGTGTAKSTSLAATWYIRSIESKKAEHCWDLPRALEPLRRLAEEELEPLAVEFFAGGRDRPYIEAVEAHQARMRTFHEEDRRRKEAEAAKRAAFDAAFAEIREAEKQRCRRPRQITGRNLSTGWCTNNRCSSADYCTYDHLQSDLPPACMHGTGCRFGALCVSNHLPMRTDAAMKRYRETFLVAERWTWDDPLDPLVLKLEEEEEDDDDDPRSSEIRPMAEPDEIDAFLKGVKPEQALDDDRGSEYADCEDGLWSDAEM
ncbi:hypothetical protein DFJ74DRAFT_667705 [Hyaloraphidium curvatum]|nr:hypothetical protein DFJ74DRAFT_667705 [Hyaloraphidium curvatum]